MNFSVYFICRASKVCRRTGLSPIEVIINVDNNRTMMTLARKINSEQWNKQSESVIGKTKEVKEINDYLNITKIKIYEAQAKLMAKNLPLTPQSVKDMFTGKMKDQHQSLVPLYQEHNDEYKAMIGKSITYASYQKHMTTLKHIKSFLKQKYNRDDIQLAEINKSFIDSFFNYIRITLNIQNNTAVNYMKNLKKICLIAWNDGIIDRNPFTNVKLHLEKVEVEYLTVKEIKSIYKKDFKNKRLNHVKDIYIFASMTGLAYIDIKEFDVKEHLHQDNDGNFWIMKKRQKTNIMSSIPLLPIPLEILDRYNFKLPVLSNQKTNSYLKEIADLCRINKKLHFHQGRHNFAMLTLNNGIPLTSVSKMLGHTNTKITQRYAKVMQSTLLKDMNSLKEKI